MEDACNKPVIIKLDTNFGYKNLTLKCPGIAL